MKTIGKYRIRGLLGRGGMSKVYKVEVPVIGKILALKWMAPHQVLIDTTGIRTLKKLFRSEAETLAGLIHPNIVSVWDYGEHREMPFFVMAYFFNSVAHLIGESSVPEEPSRPLPVDRCIAFLRQSLKGLECLHHAGIVHRDIKPFNLLLDQQDTVKICDFGLSKLRGETVELPPQLKIGSPWYAAPEQETEPDGIDVRADLYSAGICLQRMLTGHLSTEDEYLPSRVHPDLDAHWDAFIGRATAAERKNRFDSAAQMLDALDRLDLRWQRRKERICAAAGPDRNDNGAIEASSLHLRTQPTKMTPSEAADSLPVDSLWRPVTHLRRRLEASADGTTVSDVQTGRAWQLSGSPFPLDWHKARSYVEDLNHSRYGGVGIWRLPTVDELLTLLAPLPHGNALCIEPIFDSRQSSLWSSDKKSFVSAWYASLTMGFIGWQDFSARHHVRAVYTLPESRPWKVFESEFSHPGK